MLFFDLFCSVSQSAEMDLPAGEEFRGEELTDDEPEMPPPPAFCKRVPLSEYQRQRKVFSEAQIASLQQTPEFSKWQQSKQGLCFSFVSQFVDRHSYWLFALFPFSPEGSLFGKSAFLLLLLALMFLMLLPSTRRPSVPLFSFHLLSNQL